MAYKDQNIYFGFKIIVIVALHQQILIIPSTPSNSKLYVIQKVFSFKALNQYLS